MHSTELTKPSSIRESRVRLFPHLRKVQFSVLASETKRRKIPQPLSRRCKERQSININSSKWTADSCDESSGINLRIEHTKNFAVAQAQQDGCSGNYSIFDSPFANFLVPVISTRAE
ncbi:hypothetical protein G2W53_014744 [Senna tora]|uniref:Uncharacterized protein n=1 Tax=Senna tora TaxID=362788 RepID=A0A835C6W7_9FABA|nr:hypothetical protein G2W53_014744 [Senna tora]